VTDLHMPNLDGVGLVAALHNRGFDPPVLVVSCTTRSLEQVAASMGADACLAKPFALDAFLALVELLRIP
jgi:DNA-binding response OmpR family regulator